MPVRPMRMSHSNGSLTATITKVSVKRGIGQYIRIQNLSGANAMEVSFDGGTNFMTIPADGVLEVNALFHHFYLRSASGADYSALIGAG